MKEFIKFSTLVLAVQLGLLFVMGFVASAISPAVGVLFQLFVRIYEPMILLFVRWGNAGNAKGESAMIQPVLRGIAVGVVFYSIIFGVLAALFKRRGLKKSAQ